MLYQVHSRFTQGRGQTPMEMGQRTIAFRFDDFPWHIGIPYRLKQ